MFTKREINLIFNFISLEMHLIIYITEYQSYSFRVACIIHFSICWSGLISGYMQTHTSRDDKIEKSHIRLSLIPSNGFRSSEKKKQQQSECLQYCYPTALVTFSSELLILIANKVHML